MGQVVGHGLTRISLPGRGPRPYSWVVSHCFRRPVFVLLASATTALWGAGRAGGVAFMLRADGSPADTDNVSASVLVGQPIADWGELHFVDPPGHRTAADFRGDVMIVRFWTAGCPRCKASAATLGDWESRYGDRGLVVIGILLPKDKKSMDDGAVRDAARDMRWNAVLAIDPGWSALRQLWNRGGDRFSVSISLLVDRHGIVRAVHHGGYLEETDPETRAFEREMEKALSEV